METTILIIMSILVTSLIVAFIYVAIKYKMFNKLPDIGSNNTLIVPNDFDSDSYLFDFKNYQGQYSSSLPMIDNRDLSNDVSQKMKIKIKPIDVLNELERVPTPFSIELIDEKISILKDKEKLIVQSYSKREVASLIERLNNRKKYVENKTFFDLFQNTTDEMIDKLLDKYDLVMKTSDLFVPEFPEDAIKIMDEYVVNVERICGKKPLFYVISTPDLFAEKYKKRDPILLAQSPFGFYWQILGAWDSEMILLSEL